MGTPSCWRPYPVADAGAEDAQAVGEIDWVKQCILGIRRIKGEMNIPPGKPLPVLVANASEQDRRWLETARPYLDFLARTESITVLEDESAAPESAIALVGAMKLLIPMAGLIDKDAELKRLDKEIARLTDDVARTEAEARQPELRRQGPRGRGPEGARQARRACGGDRQSTDSTGEDRSPLIQPTVVRKAPRMTNLGRAHAHTWLQRARVGA